MFNFLPFKQHMNHFMQVVVDKYGKIIFERHTSATGYMKQYREIAPLADAIDKVAMAGATITPYPVLNGDFVKNTEENYNRWVLRPNSDQTGILFRKEALIHFNVAGNNFIEIAWKYDNNEQIKFLEIKNINPALVSPYILNDQIIEYRRQKGTKTIIYKKTINTKRDIVETYSYTENGINYDLFNFRELKDESDGSSITGLGLSKLYSIQDELILYQEGNKHNKRSLLNSLSAKKLISINHKELPSNIQKEDRQEYLKKLEEGYSGAEGSGKTIFTNLPLVVQDLQNQFVARDLEFNQGLRRLRVAVYNRFNIPLPKVEGEFTSNSNMKESNLNFYDEAVFPLIETYYDFVYNFIFKNYFPDLQYDKIYYCESEIPAIAFRNAELVYQLSRANVMTKNELRKKVGVAEIEGLNAVYIDGNQAPIGEDTNTDDAIGMPLSTKELDDLDALVEQMEKDELNAIELKALSDINLVPTVSMANNATRGLKWRKLYKRGGTEVGVARARDIKNRKKLSPSTVGRMVSFFARHGVNEGKNRKPNGEPTNHYIAWCLTHDTEILLADGSFETIGNIVNNKMNVEVMSRQSDGTIKQAKIINWLKLPSSQNDFMVLRRGKAKSNESGVVAKPKLFATKEHPIFTGNEYIQMQDLKSDNKVAVVEEYVDNTSEQIILGHIMGDGYLSSSGQLKLSRCNEQLEYLEDTISLTKNLNWSKINPVITKSGFGIGKTQHRSSSKCIKYLLKNPLIKIENKKRVLVGNLDRLNDIAVSRWILDDGSLHKGNGANARPSYRLHIEGYDQESANKIAKWFESKYKGTLNLHKRENCDGFVIYFGVDMTQEIAERIAKYVPNSMRYKLPEYLKNVDYVLEDHVCKTEFRYFMQEINYTRNAKASDKNKDSSKFDYRYDLTIEETHNFIANGIIVHNCLWGGNAGRSWANSKWNAIKRERGIS